MPGLLRHVVPEGVLVGPDLAGTPGGAEAVIELLAAPLLRAGRVRPSWAGAVKAREARLPTGLPLGAGTGVAVPHTDPEHVLAAGIALAVLARPVSFRSMEDPEEELATSVVIALALPSKDEQLAMLQQVALLLQDPARLARLSASRDEAGVRAALQAQA